LEAITIHEEALVDNMDARIYTGVKGYWSLEPKKAVWDVFIKAVEEW